MAHEILTVKLCEMDETIGRLHCRIHLSETAKYTQLCQEIETISRDYAETELALRKKLKYSHSKMVSLLAENYEEIEQIIQKSKADMEQLAEMSGEPDAAAEENILLAEYALDFAMQAANRALLFSLEAIKAQFPQQEERRPS